MKRFTLLFLGAIVSNFLSAQRLYFSKADTIPVFINDTVTPILNAWSGGINYPLWSGIDMNGDGLIDLYMYDHSNGRVLTFINDGSKNFNAFHDSSLKYAPLFPPVYTGGSHYSPSWGKLYDYNCDGKPDFFTLSPSSLGIAVYRNDYTPATGLQWTLISTQLEDTCGNYLDTIFASSILIPTFVDMDNDGDMDMLCFNPTPDIHIFYYKNYAEEHLGRCDAFDFHLESNCWGNFALSYGSNQASCFHCPAPSPSCPYHLAPEKNGDNGQERLDSSFLAPPVFQRDDTVTALLCIDLDGDGLKDLLVGDFASPNCLMLHNHGTLQVAEMDTEDINFPSYDTSIKISDFVYNSYIDVDNDSINDLISSSGNDADKDNIWVYKNDSTNSAPKFHFQQQDFLQGSMIDEGEAAQPILFDYDADGLKDLIIAYSEYESLPKPTYLHTKLALYRNIGTPTDPRFKFITDDYMNLDQYFPYLPSPICVTFGDLRGVGVQDMIIGGGDGYLYYFQNAAAPGQPANFPSSPTPMYFNIDVGNNAAPQLVDIDGDGHLDLIIGGQNGLVLYYHNNEVTPHVPSFNATPDNAFFGNISVVPDSNIDGWSVPFVFKNNGTTEMLVSNSTGIVYYYNNIDGNLNGTFTKVDSFFNGSLGLCNHSNLTVTAGDINGDGVPDMLVGLFTGGAQIYYGSHTPNGITEVRNNNSFVCFPNPADKQFVVRSSEFGVKNVSIEIYNVLGKKVYSNYELRTTNYEQQIDVSGLSAGLYIVAISDSKKSSYQKLLVSH